MTNFFHVPKKVLVAIAGLVWMIAGFNIMRIGTPDMIASWSSPILPLLAAAVVFFLFFKFIFFHMVQKHSVRIMAMEQERVMILHFFDTRSYCIMFFMITFGILLRSSHWVPPLYLGTFYTGLGASLMGAGIFFLIKFLNLLKMAPETVKIEESR